MIYNKLINKVKAKSLKKFNEHEQEFVENINTLNFWNV